jgi:hypothetical protein
VSADGGQGCPDDDSQGRNDMPVGARVDPDAATDLCLGGRVGHGGES